MEKSKEEGKRLTAIPAKGRDEIFCHHGLEKKLLSGAASALLEEKGEGQGSSARAALPSTAKGDKGKVLILATLKREEKVQRL